MRVNLRVGPVSCSCLAASFDGMCCAAENDCVTNPNKKQEDVKSLKPDFQRHPVSLGDAFRANLSGVPPVHQVA